MVIVTYGFDDEPVRWQIVMLFAFPPVLPEPLPEPVLSLPPDPALPLPPDPALPLLEPPDVPPPAVVPEPLPVLPVLMSVFGHPEDGAGMMSPG
jgi:hypothetical protein